VPSPGQRTRATDSGTSASTAPVRTELPDGGTHAPAAKPQVDSYDEETYHCRANDTFRTISQEFYRTDKYERALMLFNRSHPLATDAVRQDPPRLQAGQPVYVPPARILERYYPAAIADGTTSPAGVQAPVEAEKLPALRPMPTTTKSVASPKSAKEPAAKEKLYRVRANGEMILEVARRTLSNGDRWPEIYRLNPKLNPQSLIPAGTQLRLPSDAQVDAADRP
jgi:hypothetical protein